MFNKTAFELPPALTDAFLALEANEKNLANNVHGMMVVMESFDTIHYVLAHGEHLFDSPNELQCAGFDNHASLEAAQAARDVILIDLFKNGFILNAGVGKRAVVDTHVDHYNLRLEVVGHISGMAWIDQRQSDVFSIDSPYDLYRAMVRMYRRSIEY